MDKKYFKKAYFTVRNRECIYVLKERRFAQPNPVKDLCTSPRAPETEIPGFPRGCCPQRGDTSLLRASRFNYGNWHLFNDPPRSGVRKVPSLGTRAQQKNLLILNRLFARSSNSKMQTGMTLIPLIL